MIGYHPCQQAADRPAAGFAALQLNAALNDWNLALINIMKESTKLQKEGLHIGALT